MRKRFVLLLGLFLGSHVPVAAQTPAPGIVLSQEHVAPIITMLPTVSTHSPAHSFLLSQNPEKSNDHFRLIFAGAYKPDYSLEHLLSMNEVKTSTLTQSSLPLVQLWSGRLQLDAFQSTLHIRDALLNPFDNGGVRGSRLPGHSYPGVPHSVDLSGLSLHFHFSRNTQTGDPAQAWRRLPRIFGIVLN